MSSKLIEVLDLGWNKVKIPLHTIVDAQYCPNLASDQYGYMSYYNLITAVGALYRIKAKNWEKIK